VFVEENDVGNAMHVLESIVSVNLERDCVVVLIKNALVVKVASIIVLVNVYLFSNF